MSKARMSGNPDATLSGARDVLRKAKQEAKGQGRGLQARQAAEKVWLAASTAADALVGGKIDKSAQVFKTFERAWGAEGRAIAEDIEMALHRGCFYSNAAACDGTSIDRYVARLGRILNRPIRDRELKRRVGMNGRNSL